MFSDYSPEDDEPINEALNADYNTTPKHNLGDGGYRTLPTPQDE